MGLSFATALVIADLFERSKLLDDLADFLAAYDMPSMAAYVRDELRGAYIGYGSNVKRIAKQALLSFREAEREKETLVTVAEALLNELTSDVKVFRPYLDPYAQRRVADLIGLLERDGFTYRQGKLLRSEASVLDVEQERGIIEALIDRNSELSGVELKEHLRASVEHQANGRPKEAVGRARDLVGQLLADIAKVAGDAHGKTPPAPKPGEGGTLRTFLVQEGFLDQREADDLVKPAWNFSGLWGHHRWIPDEKIARVGMAHTLTVAFYLLEKFEEWKQKGYPTTP